jgi:hypothetical protein
MPIENVMNKLEQSNSRHILKSSLAAVGAVVAGPQIVRTQTLGKATKNAANSRNSMGFIGTKGEVRVSRDKFETLPKEVARHQFTANDVQVYESKNHRQNFIDSILSRKPTICPATIDHRTGSICLVAGIAERLGRALKWDPVAEQIIDDPEAAAMQSRPRCKEYELPDIG